MLIQRGTVVLFVLVGLINIAPISGLFGSHALEKLYGISIISPDLLMLMQHRAVLLAIVGSFLVVAGFMRSLRPAAAIAGYASMVSYSILFSMSGSTNSNLEQVFWFDVAALVLLTLAIWGHKYSVLSEAAKL